MEEVEAMMTARDDRMMMKEGWKLYDDASGFCWDGGDDSLDGTVMTVEATGMTTGCLLTSIESHHQ